MELDTSVLEKKQSTTTTMADMYGYSVFSKDFQQKLEIEKEKQKKERDYYLDCVFVNEPEDGVDQAFKQVITAETAVIVKEDFTADSTKETTAMEMIGFTILGALLAGVVWMLIEKVRKGKKSS